MALTGKFEADFVSFYDAVKKAEVSLQSFDSGANKVEKSLNRMVDGFSGRRVIQDATLMAEAVEKVGGVTKLTTDELVRFGGRAAEAAEKMRALGMDVPERLQKLADAGDRAAAVMKRKAAATGEASNAIGTFRDGLSQADRSLAAFGVQIGPQIRALEELAAGAGKTAAQLGTIATVGLSAAAGLGGLKIGRFIADFAGTDDAIGRATANLFGFGDAAERAAARTDVLSRATYIARRAITDFAEAQRIIIAENARIQASFNNAETRVKSWQSELARVRAAGDLPALRADLQSQNSTLQELSAQYHITARALEFYQRTIKDSAKAQKEWADEARAKYAKLAEAQEALDNAGEGWRKTLAAINVDTIAAVERYLAMGASQDALATKYGLTALQVRAVGNALREQMEIIARVDTALTQSASNLTKQLIANGQTFNKEWEKEIQQYSRMAALAKQLEAELRPAPSKSPRESLEEDTRGFESMRGIWTDEQISRALNDLYESFYRREGAAGRMPGTSYAPAAGVSEAPVSQTWNPQSIRRPGDSTNNNVTVNMNGLLATTDPSGKAALREAVNDAVMAGLRARQKVGSA